MWIAIGIIGAASLVNLAVLLLVLARLQEAETFLVIMAGIIIGGETSAQLAAYIRSRSDHPAGKKGVRSVRRMDEGDTPRASGEH